MTLRTDMIQTVRMAPACLGDASTHVARFFRSHEHPDGGYRGRSEASDLYYTVFGLEGSWALDSLPDVESLRDYLSSYRDGQELDLVHLSCLARCWATLTDLTGALLNSTLRSGLVDRLEMIRCADGGFNTGVDEASASVYGCFLALGAYQDLGMAVPNSDSFLASARSLRLGDGSFTNDHSTHEGSTPATAAALCILHYLDQPFPDSSIAWLLGQSLEQGGFCAVPHGRATAIADLLSTATALFALRQARVRLKAHREKTLDFCDSLWNSKGGFAGHVMDPVLDCEYTYYGLLALGCVGSDEHGVPE